MMLEPLAGTKVLDLFAGSGALGIEALSRGAERVDFVESEAAPRRVLEANLATLGIADRTRVWPLRLPEGLKRLGGRVAEAELVLLDPPYGGALARATLEALAAGPVAATVRVVVEHHAKDALPEAVGALGRVRQQRTGETTISIYRRRPDEAHEGGEPS